MQLTKIHAADSPYICHLPIENVPSDILIVVPTEEDYHTISGNALLLNKKWEVQLLEPGTPLSWQGMYSPYHLNTPEYVGAFVNHAFTYIKR